VCGKTGGARGKVDLDSATSFTELEEILADKREDSDTVISLLEWDEILVENLLLSIAEELREWEGLSSLSEQLKKFIGTPDTLKPEIALYTDFA